MGGIGLNSWEAVIANRQQPSRPSTDGASPTSQQPYYTHTYKSAPTPLHAHPTLHWVQYRLRHARRSTMNSVQDAVNVVSTAQEDGDAAASAKPEQQQPPTASIDAPATTSASRSSPSVPSASATGEHAQQPSIEEDVKQLVSDVSSWWSGFSKRVSDVLTRSLLDVVDIEYSTC